MISSRDDLAEYDWMSPSGVQLIMYRLPFLDAVIDRISLLFSRSTITAPSLCKIIFQLLIDIVLPMKKRFFCMFVAYSTSVSVLNGLATSSCNWTPISPLPFAYMTLLLPSLMGTGRSNSIYIRNHSLRDVMCCMTPESISQQFSSSLSERYAIIVVAGFTIEFA